MQIFLAEIVWSRGAWLPLAVLATVLITVLSIWNYASHQVLNRLLTWLAISLKTVGFGLIAACLLEPSLVYRWPRPQANIVGILVDASASMNVGAAPSEIEQLRKEYLASASNWQAKIAQNFDLRRHTFGSQINSTNDLTTTEFSATKSNLAAAIENVTERMSQRPVAAIFLLTDGNATDAAQLNAVLTNPNQRARIYPVLVSKIRELKDLRISDVIVRVANFESAPVTLDVRLSSDNMRGQKVIVQVFDAQQKLISQQPTTYSTNSDQHQIQLRLTDTPSGVQRYTVKVCLQSEVDATGTNSDEWPTVETTLVNNRRAIIVDRKSGPYRILYVAGRPNWELKFLRRAVSEDPEINFVALVRIAKREAKFAFRDQAVGNSNSLFSGFDEETAETAEQNDEPVFTRLGIRDAMELRGGFPDSRPELFSYDMIIIDDLEGEFFSAAQLQSLQRFVTDRGGTLLILGGQESFTGRAFQNGPLSQMMPFYFSKSNSSPVNPLRFQLTREGWLEPSLRLSETEADEATRVEKMPSFQSTNSAEGVKPGAILFATGADSQQKKMPLLATQRFGQGKTAALLLSDFWRWSMSHPAMETKADKPVTSPAMIAWRQIVRWLITEVPRQIDVTATDNNKLDSETVMLRTRILDEEHRPLDNAVVNLQVLSPDNQTLHLSAKSSDEQAGIFEAETYPSADGAYIVTATATDETSEAIGTSQTGFVINASADEMSRLQPNMELLEKIAERTGGKVLQLNQLDQTASDLTTLDVEETVVRSEPLWHKSLVLLLAFAAIVSEWAMRRMRGLP